MMPTPSELADFCELVRTQLILALPPAWKGWTEAERRYYLAQLNSFWFVRAKSPVGFLVTFEVTACQYEARVSMAWPGVRVPWMAVDRPWDTLSVELRRAVDAVVVLIVDEFKAEKAPLRSRVDRVLDDESPPPPKKMTFSNWLASERASILAATQGTSIIDRILQGHGL